MEEGKVENIDKIKGLCEKLVDSNDSLSWNFCGRVRKLQGGNDQKNVHITTDLFTHIASVKCLTWFPIPRSMSKQQRMVSKVACIECAKLKHDLRRAAKRISSATPAPKVQHQQAESMKYFSPPSLKTQKTKNLSKSRKEG